MTTRPEAKLKPKPEPPPKAGPVTVEIGGKERTLRFSQNRCLYSLSSPGQQLDEQALRVRGL